MSKVYFMVMTDYPRYFDNENKAFLYKEWDGYDFVNDSNLESPAIYVKAATKKEEFQKLKEAFAESFFKDKYNKEIHKRLDGVHIIKVTENHLFDVRSEIVGTYSWDELEEATKDMIEEENRIRFEEDD